jgi:hypothetical protein
MKPTALHIERWLDGVEARIVPPERRGLQVIIHEGDDEAAAMEKAVAEHIAAHPEDAGRTVKDFRWVVWEIVRKPQELPQELFEDELTAKDTDEDAAVSETDLNVLTPPDPDYLARSKPWRPVLICADRRGRNGKDDPARSR